MSCGDVVCPVCGVHNPFQPHFCAGTRTYPNAVPVPANIHEYGRYTWTPNPLTADEVRKIVREEIERASQQHGAKP